MGVAEFSWRVIGLGALMTILCGLSFGADRATPGASPRVDPAPMSAVELSAPSRSPAS